MSISRPFTLSELAEGDQFIYDGFVCEKTPFGFIKIFTGEEFQSFYGEIKPVTFKTLKPGDLFQVKNGSVTLIARKMNFGLKTNALDEFYRYGLSIAQDQKVTVIWLNNPN